MKLDVVALITAIGGLATTIFNYLHGRTDGSTVRDLKETIEKQARDTARVTRELSAAFKDTRTMLADLIAAMKQQGSKS